jgi:hypothetical protein
LEVYLEKLKLLEEYLAFEDKNDEDLQKKFVLALIIIWPTNLLLGQVEASKYFDG